MCINIVPMYLCGPLEYSAQGCQKREGDPWNCSHTQLSAAMWEGNLAGSTGRAARALTAWAVFPASIVHSWLRLSFISDHTSAFHVRVPSSLTQELQIPLLFKVRICPFAPLKYVLESLIQFHKNKLICISHNFCFWQISINWVL